MQTLLHRSFFALLLAAASLSSQAGLYYSWTGDQAIPDNDANGVAFSFNLADETTTISDITVNLDISSGYNGDLYAYLSHGDGFAVLLNRVGRSASSEFGYSNSGFLVSLSASASPDIHNYQTLDPGYNGNGQLTGTWGADGRDEDPALSLNSIPRNATLASFNDLNPNGQWTLFLCDSSPGGISTLNGWSVEVNPVPEPVNVALGIFAAAGIGFQGIRKWLLRRRDRTT